MTQGTVGFSRDGQVAHITFSRPESRNAMTWSMYQRFGEILDELARADGVRVVVLRGEGGKAFIAGTDISQFLEFKTVDEGVAYEEVIEGLIGRLEALPIPTVAVVEGYAVGGGLAIAAACDLRLCTPDARFGAPIARTVGNCLSMQNYARLAALIGVSRAKAMLFTASMIGAEDALNAGLVLDVVERDALDQRVGELCATLASHAPLTLRVTKEAFRRITHGHGAEGADLVRIAYESRDFQEGVAAFMEKRAPEWQGR